MFSLKKESLEELVLRLTENCTKVLSLDVIKENDLWWGGNGVGDRWANKKFNYCTIFSKKVTNHSENEEDSIPAETLKQFRETVVSSNDKSSSERAKSSDCPSDDLGCRLSGKTQQTTLSGKSSSERETLSGKSSSERATLSGKSSSERATLSGILGIYVYSKRINVDTRPIREDILLAIKKMACVSCGSHSDIVCDHKNDFYNDPRVLNRATQVLDDFQSLCTHCNLQKRQICKREKETGVLYSAKQIPKYAMFDFEFTWEKKKFDLSDKDCKKGTYWYDPIEFSRNIYMYMKGIKEVA
jgi:hypothetical protein